MDMDIEHQGFEVRVGIRTKLEMDFVPKVGYYQ